MKGIIRYNKLRSDLSKYVKANGINLPKGSFNKLNTEVFRSTKEEPFDQVVNNIDIFVNDYINPDEGIDVIPNNRWWTIEEELAKFPDEQQIVLDNSTGIDGGEMFVGSIGQLKGKLSSIYEDINGQCKRAKDLYLNYKFTIREDEKGIKTIYAVLVDENEVLDFDIDEHFDFEDVQPEPEPDLPFDKQIQLEQEKQKTLQLQIEADKAATEKAKSLGDLINKGFSPDQIMKLFNLE